MSLLSVSTSQISSQFSYAAEGGGVNVDLDASLLVQVGLFVLLLLILKPLLFDPMLKLFEEREKRIEGTRRKAQKLDEESAEAATKREAILAKARDAGSAERDALKAEGARKEAETMERVRATVARTIEDGRAAIATEATSARTQLGNESIALGRAIASRALGREVAS